MTAGRRGPRRRAALLAAALLVALAAFAWWLSGRWLARPERPAPAVEQNAVPDPE